MNPNYVSKVQHFGGPRPYVDGAGRKRNLSHNTDLDVAEVETDGLGNVMNMPLLERKPCFGRPERFLRGIFGASRWVDDKGEQRVGGSTCYTCEERCLGTFLACQDLVAERIESSAGVENEFVNWIQASGSRFGLSLFNGSLGVHWATFLAAIEIHGGWFNKNDDQVKASAIARADSIKRKKARSASKYRERERARRKGVGRPISNEFLKAVDVERDRRAAQLVGFKSLRGSSRKDTLWLSALPESTCERVADVWRARETLTRQDGVFTGKAIAELLIASNRGRGMTSTTLQARVSDDLKRIRKLEDSTAGDPLWAPFEFEENVP